MEFLYTCSAGWSGFIGVAQAKSVLWEFETWLRSTGFLCPCRTLPTGLRTASVSALFSPLVSWNHSHFSDRKMESITYYVEQMSTMDPTIRKPVYIFQPSFLMTCFLELHMCAGFEQVLYFFFQIREYMEEIWWMDFVSLVSEIPKCVTTQKPTTLYD